jgi:hypothetical protein
MNALRTIVKAVLPTRVRTSLRAYHRAFIFRHATRQFLKDPEACTQPDNPVLTRLIYGWGNASWSALNEYLAACIGHALTADGPILECGSGLSTLLVGAVAKRRGLRHWALEHTPAWATKVQSYLDMYKIDSVSLCTSPLKEYGDFCWYDAPVESIADGLALVICDGPPGDTRGGRYGLGAIMRDRLKPGCVILLDDAGREQERAVASRWATELGASVSVLGSIKPYIKLTVGDAPCRP